MTTPPNGPLDPRRQPAQQRPQPQPPQQGQPYPPPPGRGRNKALPWLIGGALVVVAAVVVTLVLVLGDDGDGDTAGDYDLSSPTAAAKSFAAAARTGNAAEVLALTCAGDDACVKKLGGGATAAELAEFKRRVEQGMGELADQLAGVEFEEPVDASSYLDGAMEVPYHTPAMPDGETRGMIFIEFDGKWLYAGGSSGNSGSSDAPDAGPGSGPADTTEPTGPETPPEPETTTDPTTCVPTSDANNPFPHC